MYTKISNLEGKLENAVSPTVYDETVRLYNEQKAQLSEANTKISKLEVDLGQYMDTYRVELAEAVKTLKAKVLARDIQLERLRSREKEAVANTESRKTEYGKDPYAPDTHIPLKYYDDKIDTMNSRCNPHTTDQKFIKTQCILEEVEAVTNKGGCNAC